MEKRYFGTLPSGEEVYIYSLLSDGARVNVMNRGAAIVSFEVYGTDIVGGWLRRLLG